MDLSELDDAHYNPRADLGPEDREFQQIRASVGEFGLVVPLVYNERTGRLVGGHQRKKVLADLGETEADVVVVDLDEERERALNVALNRKGRWDYGKLSTLLEEVRTHDLLDVTGYAAGEVDEMIRMHHSADFLDDLLAEADDEGAKEEAERSRPVPNPVRSVRFMLNDDQKEIVYGALAAAHDEDEVGNSNEAIVAIARRYAERG